MPGRADWRAARVAELEGRNVTRDSNSCGRLVIAGASSGVGKTSLAVGLIRALMRRGLRVQPFKVGPDFLDPTYLSRAAGRTCYNVDGWMMGRGYVEELLTRVAADADIAVIEGVMGLFDGAEWNSLAGSTAEMSVWLEAPVLLVMDAHGAARSLAAAVKGFAEFEPAVRIAGIIANRCGSGAHAAGLAESLSAAGLPPLAGGVPKDALPELRSRHLGLRTADKEAVPAGVFEQLADACEKHLDMDAILALARKAGPLADAPVKTAAPAGQRVRIGIARDGAFHFYYPDNLESLERHGAELVPFSPAADAALPEGLGGLYIGGGYPEEYAAELSANRAMRAAVRSFADSGRPVYAECGGLMYLCDELVTTDGARHPMAGVLPVSSRMLPKLRSLGYAEVTLNERAVWGGRGASCRGHEFHYSELTGGLPDGSGWRPAYSVRGAHRGPERAEGFQKGQVLASYVHLHFASRPGVAEHFVGRCREPV